MAQDNIRQQAQVTQINNMLIAGGQAAIADMKKIKSSCIPLVIIGIAGAASLSLAFALDKLPPEASITMLNVGSIMLAVALLSGIIQLCRYNKQAWHLETAVLGAGYQPPIQS